MAEDVRSSAPGEFGGLRLASALITFEDETVDLDTLAAGDVVVKAWAEVLVAFDAGTTNVITLGNGTTADKFLAAADVTEGTPGAYPAAYKAPYTAEAAAGTLRATYAQTGDVAEAGEARIYALISSAPA